MNVRARLLTGFTIVALFVLSVFAVLGHYSAIDLTHKHEQMLLGDYAESLANDISRHLQRYGEKEGMVSLPLMQPSEHNITVLLNKQNQVILSNQPNAKQIAFQTLLPSSLRNGAITLFDKRYSWAIAAIPDTPYRLLLLHNEVEVSSYLHALNLKILITALISIGLAFLAALFLSKRIVRILDAQNAAIEYHALHDEITNLPNRRALSQHLQHIRAPSHYNLLIIDLNNLRDVNDTLGHHAGDQLVRVAGRRIKEMASHCEIIARLGGDAFAILCTLEVEKAEALARELIYQLSMPIEIDGMSIITHASIGCACYPDDADSPEVLLNHAEIAMSHSKQENINFQRYNSSIDPFSQQRLGLISRLREAIQNGELCAYYQPKVDLKNMQTTGVEVLVRWNHPQRGIIPPDHFIPIAERCDLIDKLTHWVLDEALHQCHVWHSQGLRLSVAVNLSARNLMDANLASHVEALLNKWQIPPNQLKLEITESIIMADPETALHTLKQLDSLGVPLSVDDYGTGYSSLSYIKRLPVSEIKIDRTFVKDMLTNQEDEVIVASTIELAHKLGLCVVAEGVENKATLERLAELQCERAQGYHMSPPLPALELDKWLAHCDWPAIT